VAFLFFLPSSTTIQHMAHRPAAKSSDRYSA